MEELQNLTPLYNKEFYLAYLCGEDVELPIPDGNTEHYLAYLCGMDVPIPDPLYTKVKENRVNFMCKADYSENAEIHTTVKLILDKIRADYDFAQHLRQAPIGGSW